VRLVFLLLPMIILLGGCSASSLPEEPPPGLVADVAAPDADDASARPTSDARRGVMARDAMVESKANSASRDQRDVASSLAEDERLRQLVVGTWEDDYEGHRTMTLNADGSGVMVVELSGWKAKLFAPRLEFNMRWSLSEGRLQKRTLDGQPEQLVSVILTTMGDHVGRADPGADRDPPATVGQRRSHPIRLAS